MPPRVEWVAAGTAWLVLAGCAPADGSVDDGRSAGGEAFGEAASPIEDGEADATSSAVVSVRNVDKQLLCSGALIAPNLVLTAFHCVGSTQQPAATAGISYCSKAEATDLSPASAISVSTQAQAPNGPGEHPAAGLLGPPGAPALCGRDIALVLLETPISASEAVPLSPRVDGDLVVGETYAAFGFGGVDEDGSDLGVRRRRDDLAIFCVGEACPDNSALPEVELSEWLGQDAVCPGDSGGPAIDDEGRVIGVASRGAQGCNDPVYASTVAWSGWLKDGGAYAAGAAEAVPPDWAAGAALDPAFAAPVGKPCGSGADCYTGACFDDGDELYCSRPCDADHLCPNTFVCDPEAGLCARAIGSGDEGCALGGAPPDQSYWTLLVGLAFCTALRRCRRKPVGWTRNAADISLPCRELGPSSLAYWSPAVDAPRDVHWTRRRSD